ncbi:HEAT repeat domain-containing protein [Bryobacter aggregatus]|uniref:HEAT repeat domain-containing protein n=1 Tax=Bryobacter aggregatus TaxID=360054 RepID=UPI0004E0BADA|nr:HEAT repeat domain-containing protein [Bryobacter aggregatus]
MKYFLLTGLACLYAADPVGPRIGIIDSYGAHSFSTEKLRKELKVAEGDPLPPSKGDLEELLIGIKGIARANVEAICCEQGKAIFYIGVEERGRPHLDIREEPKNETLVMPEDVTAMYNRLIAAIAEATRVGETSEDWSQGYALMQNLEARLVQMRLPAMAEDQQKILREILREGADPDDRRVAATVLGYGPKSQAIIEDLQLALRDPDQEVRAAALRSLAPLASYARKHPEAEIRVLTTWFVEMLNSVAWKDRMNAMNLLIELTAERDEKLIRHMKERGIPALAEMAQWKHLPHALPAYILLGRVADLSEQEIQDTWSANQREDTIKKIRKKLKA